MRLAILYESWLTHPDVGSDEIAVLAVLALHTNREGTCFPTQGLLASLLGRSRPWVNKVIGTLVDAGLVIRTHRVRSDGGDRACLYRLVAPVDVSPVVTTASTSPESTSPKTTIRHAHDTLSSRCDTPSHQPDSVKTPLEHKQETHPADAPNVLPYEPLSIEMPSETWQPTDDDLAWACERFPSADLQAVTERFINRCRAKGYRYRDLSAAWRSWLADDATTGRFAKRGTKPQPATVRFDAWAAVAARAGKNQHAC